MLELVNKQWTERNLSCGIVALWEILVDEPHSYSSIQTKSCTFIAHKKLRMFYHNIYFELTINKWRNDCVKVRPIAPVILSEGLVVCCLPILWAKVVSDSYQIYM